jgi:uncharacterized protein
VYPVNPRLQEVDCDKCYASLVEIPVKVDIVDFVVPPKATEEILKQCKELGLNRIWLQPGSESEIALAYCQENNLKVIHGICVMLSREKLNKDLVVILKPDESTKNKKLEE